MQRELMHNHLDSCLGNTLLNRAIRYVSITSLDGALGEKRKRKLCGMNCTCSCFSPLNTYILNYLFRLPNRNMFNLSILRWCLIWNIDFFFLIHEINVMLKQHMTDI